MHMLLVLYALFWLGFTQEIPEVYKNHKNFKLLNMGDNCGFSAVNRIIGGEKASLGEYPWIVRIGYTYDPEVGAVEKYECGGSIISDIYILTAAHCSPEVLKYEWIEIRAGEHKISNDTDCDSKGVCAAPLQDIQIHDYFCHKGFDPDITQDDICIIRLETPLKFNIYVQPICLPFYEKIINEDLEEVIMEVAGWGITNPDKEETADVLLKLKIPVVNHDECVEAYKLKKEIVPYQLCAGGQKGRDSCKGDSGGPLMKPFSIGGPPRYFLIGVVSLGPAPCGSEEGTPGVYTSVTMYLKWILDNLPTEKYKS